MNSANYKTVLKVVIPLAILVVALYSLHVLRNRPAYQPVYSNGVINKDIVALAKIQNAAAKLPPASSLTAWNDYLQKNFLRPAGIDHNDMANMQQDPKHAQMAPLFNALGMVKTINPSRTKYNYIFVFGGTPNNTNERFKVLEQNINTKKLHVNANITVTYINGRRKISASEIAEAKKLGVDCEYQHQCAELIWTAHYSSLPVKLEVMTIDPPEGRRANTEDTLKAFFARIPIGQPTKVLGYSNQPYVPYQGDTAVAVAVYENRKDLKIEVVGGSSPVPVATITYLDSIARRVFTKDALLSN